MKNNLIEVVNVKKVGFKGVVYIGREMKGVEGSVLGNRFRMRDESEREEVINRYREWFLKEVKREGEVREEIIRLYRMVKRGEKIRLGCWCKERSCHGDVIKEFLEEYL